MENESFYQGRGLTGRGRDSRSLGNRSICRVLVQKLVNLRVELPGGQEGFHRRHGTCRWYMLTARMLMCATWERKMQFNESFGHAISVLLLDSDGYYCFEG